MSKKLIETEIMRLLHKRGEEKTICPSEVARKLYPKTWRTHMDAIREVAIQLAQNRQLVITQKKQPIDPPHIKGPIRLQLHPSQSTC